MLGINKATVILLSGTLIVLLSAIFMGCFGFIFTSIINKMLVIDPESEVFTQFESPSTPIYLDFYLFNVTNPGAVQHYGAKPRLVELGPYRYREVMLKYGYIWDHEDGTVSYRQNTTYFFEPGMSFGTEKDRITTLNAVMVVLGAMTYNETIINRFIWPEIEAGMDLFESFTVGELIFEGWELPTFDFDVSYIPGFEFTQNLTGTICDISNELELDVPCLEDNKFGIYSWMNGSNDGLYTVKTGENGMDDFLYVQSWNGDTELSYWDSPYCNMINGTDGTQYPPGITKGETLRLFSTDLCRSMYLEYVRDTQILGLIDTYHHVPPPSMLESPNTNEDNVCYCEPLPADDGCLGDSMLNMAPCMKGAPIVLSTPHFYQGNKKDQNKVIGLDPKKELHETFLNVEPITGVVMEAAKRIQLNLPLRRYGNLPSFQNVPDLIFPIFWASENAQIGEDDAQKMHKALTLPYTVVYSVCGVIILVGLILILVGAIKHNKAKSNFQMDSLITEN